MAAYSMVDRRKSPRSYMRATGSRPWHSPPASSSGAPRSSGQLEETLAGLSRGRFGMLAVGRGTGDREDALGVEARVEVARVIEHADRASVDLASR